MFILKLIDFRSKSHQNLNQVKTQITVKPFVDLFLDTAGWYALGHHDRKQFLATVIKKEKSPYSHFCPRQVQLCWAKIDGNSFELVEKRTKDSQPITLIEDEGLLNEDY